MLNNVIIEGNLTKDATPRGKAENPVLAFSIANNRNVKRGDNWEQEVTYFDCALFGNRAKALCEYLKKGVRVVVSGRLDINTYCDADGITRRQAQIIVNDLSFMSPKKEESETPWN